MFSNRGLGTLRVLVQNVGILSAQLDLPHSSLGYPLVLQILHEPWSFFPGSGFPQVWARKMWCLFHLRAKSEDWMMLGQHQLRSGWPCCHPVLLHQANDPRVGWFSWPHTSPFYFRLYLIPTQRSMNAAATVRKGKITAGHILTSPELLWKRNLFPQACSVMAGCQGG